ncbi:MAG: hypothetical protein CVV02_01870 [Firmicutes bacterium HGW-Firmicutes-7]|nr:MAG: hypothetical protein CVV02_01870 [Firmicutes bacterium HGW-Firmicutes-7]
MGILALEREKGLYLGIDFGTTNSVVSIYIYDDEQVYTVPIDGSNIFPTVIQFESSNEEDVDKLDRIFGIGAKESAVIFPESTVMSIKRFLDTDEIIKIVVAGRTFEFKPENIVAEILSYLKDQADAYIRDVLKMSGEFTGCVITVPANSTDKQKKKTKDAAIMAGFDEANIYLRLEPAAAAIAYATRVHEDKKVLIYDFGGGTFDACILQIKATMEDEPEITILSTFGDNYLGGNDIDKIMMDMIYQEFVKQTNGTIDLFDLNKDDGVSKKNKKMALVRLYQVANAAKERLSSALSTKVVLAPFIQEPYIVNINMEISRELFMNHKRLDILDDNEENFIKMSGKSVKDLIQETMDCIRKCIDMAHLEKEHIDEIFLVGGTSSIPEVKNMISEYFSKEPFQTKLSPALSISTGAAYYCNRIMLPSMSGPSVLEKTIHPLGLEISGRRFLEIVKRDMEIPKEGLVVEADELLETNFDGITSMAIAVYEDTLPQEQRLKFVYEKGLKRLAGTTLRGIPPKNKGEEKVNVYFRIGQDNMLCVEAKSTSEEGIETRLSVDKMY